MVEDEFLKFISDHVRAKKFVSDHVRAKKFVSDHVRSKKFVSEHVRGQKRFFLTHVVSSEFLRKQVFIN